jgi:Outer membrane protein beta-barrel domain
MSNLKDTDIDDLFRRASDKYPLRTDSADWDRMAAALEKEPPAPSETADGEDNRKKRRFLWLFLLLPLAGAGYYTWQHAGNSGNMGRSASVVATAPAAGQSAPAAGQTTTATDKTGTADQTSATGQATTARTATTDQTTSRQPQAATGQPQAATTKTATGQPQTAGIAQPDAAGGTQGPSTASTALSTAGKRSLVKQSNHSKNEDTQPDNSLSLTAANTRQQPGGESIGSESIGGESIATQNRKGGVEEDRLFYDLQRAPIPHDYHLAVDVTAPAAKKDTTKSKTQTRTKHFYAGIFGSPDLSTVKMQSVKGVGSTFGVILGYTFNGGHWAIETGANLDRKKYYTDGEYFNTKEVNLPLNSYLTEVNGICYMWEIPLNVRYNFNPGAKTSWFATAGFSTYLMSHEKYAYGLQWSGSTAVYDSSWNIHKPSQYPFSIVNLSAGFEQRLGKIGNLRVEPYVRLPLTGLGTGKLSIMSAGVNIGITRQLW